MNILLSKSQEIKKQRSEGCFSFSYSYQCGLNFKQIFHFKQVQQNTLHSNAFLYLYPTMEVTAYRKLASTNLISYQGYIKRPSLQTKRTKTCGLRPPFSFCFI